jgi:hypothetical protein
MVIRFGLLALTLFLCTPAHSESGNALLQACEALKVVGPPRRPRTLTKASIRVKMLILDKCCSGGALTAAGSWSLCLRRGAHNVSL